MKILLPLSIFLSVVLIGCTIPKRSDNPRKISEQRQLVRDQLSDEVSLRADRRKLDDLRKDIPEEKREANDELAFSLDQAKDLKEEPSVVRQRFHDLVQKKRIRFNQKVEKIRKQYQKDETARRDSFVKEQNKKRDSYKRKNKTSEETREFYSTIEKDRVEFYSKEREKRQDFDDEIHQQTRDFNEYMKLKNDEFTEKMRDYRVRYDAAKKNGTMPVTVPAGTDENPKLPEPKPDNE